MMEASQRKCIEAGWAVGLGGVADFPDVDGCGGGVECWLRGASVGIGPIGGAELSKYSGVFANISDNFRS